MNLNLPKKWLITLLFIFGVMINVLFLFTHSDEFWRLSTPGSAFWDLNVYKAAVSAFNAGSNPYLEINDLRFVYSPYVLFLFSFFGENLEKFFVAVYIITFLFFSVSRHGLELIIASAILSILLWKQVFFAHAVITGNITTFAHLLIISCASFGLRISFISSVFLMAFIKPYLAAYFVFGLILWGNEWKVRIWTAVAIVSLPILFSLQAFTHQKLFQDFLTSISAQALGQNNVKDVGIGFYRLFAYFQDSYMALIGHFAVLTLIISVLFLVFYQLKKLMIQETYNKLTFYSSIVIVNLSNPRLKLYDYWLIVASTILIIFFIFNELNLLTSWRKIIGLLFFCVFISIILSFMNSYWISVIVLYFLCIVAFSLLMYFYYNGDKL